MGLDIRAFRNLTIVPDAPVDRYGSPVSPNQIKFGELVTTTNEDWENRAEPLSEEQIYTYEEDFDFRAGSYIGYNEWRDLLEDFAPGDSFTELINFSDCEGVIGSIVAEKLYNDFCSYREAALLFKTDDDEWFVSKYDDWMEAFLLAKDNGAVVFC